MENIVSGLISGLVATLLTVAFRSFWNSVIVPWFEERVYKDIKIEGQWFSVYPEWGTIIREETITLNRNGHAVNGLIVCVSEGDKGEQYSVTGSFRNMTLTLTYESIERSKSDRGSIALRSVKNGNRLVGKIAFYNDNQESIESEVLLWFRTKEDAEKYLDNLRKNSERIKSLSKESNEIEEELELVEEIASEEKIKRIKKEIESNK